MRDQLVRVVAACSLLLSAALAAAFPDVVPLGVAGADVPGAALVLGSAIQVITGFVTAPDTTLTAWGMAAGDTLTVKNAPEGKPIRLLQAWGDWQTAGVLRILSTRMHDALQGIRLNGVASEVEPLLPWQFQQRLYAQDALSVTQSGSATAADIETGVLLLHYDDLPGSNGRFITADELRRRGVNEMAISNTLALGVAGGYSGEEAINAEFDTFKANTDYALLGYLVTAECAVVGWRGPDLGNLRVGGPGNESKKELTANWFERLSMATGLPCIPVINSANKAATLIDGAQDENGTDTTVTSIYVELSAGAGR